jgi:hypothetical protein
MKGRTLTLRVVIAGLVAILLAGPALAERAGTAAQLIRGTDLKKSPVEGAASAGRLPRGTVLTLTGLQRNGFVSVEVELADGAVQGWVPREYLNRSVRESLPDDPAVFNPDETEEGSESDGEEPPPSRRSDNTDESEVRSRPRSRIKLPKDEGVLLRREETFYYGVHGGGGVSFLQNATTNTFFIGPGFSVGGYGGFILSSSLAIQGEIGYALLDGEDPDGQVDTLSFGFFTVEATGVYVIDCFELHGGLGYYNGLSLSAGAAQVNGLTSAADLSTITFHVGGAFRLPLSDVISVNFAVRYVRGLIEAPIGISTVKGMVFLQFRG